MKLNVIIVFVLSVFVMSCKDNPQQKVENDSGLIEISKVQFESEKMIIGEPQFQLFADKVHFTGSIVPSIDGQARISLPLPGIIDNIRCNPTQRVKKGAVLFEISGHWFIDLQKDYAESSAILSKLESDYKRAKELHEENIGTQKEYTAAKSNFFAENARYKALQKQLISMGLDVVQIEAGTFYSSFPIKSPISGFVSNVNAAIGQYVEPQQTIVEIVDSNSFQLKLSVFARDLQKVESGQQVEFYFNGDKTQKYHAVLNAIGKTILPSSKSIQCYASIETPHNVNMVCNQFAEGEILTAVDSLWAIPETSVLESGNDFYILRYANEDDETYYFEKIKVNVGRKSNNYIELTEQMPLGKILLGGMYNVVIE